MARNYNGNRICVSEDNNCANNFEEIITNRNERISESQSVRTKISSEFKDFFEFKPTAKQHVSTGEKRWYEIILRTVKISLYIFLFSVTLVGSILSRSAIIFAARHVNTNISVEVSVDSDQSTYELTASKNDIRLTWIWGIIFAFATPEILDILIFIRNFLFNDWNLPKSQYVIFYTVIEISHTMGLALLFFAVLPNSTVVGSQVLLGCIYFIPSFMGLLTSFSRNKGMWYNNTFVNLLGFFSQGAILSAYTYFYKLDHNLNYDSFELWIIPLACVLSSMRWWGNYVSHDCQFGFIRLLAKVRDNLQNCRNPIIMLYKSVIRIIAFVACAAVIFNYCSNDRLEFQELFNFQTLLLDENQFTYRLSNPNINATDLYLYQVYPKIIHGIILIQVLAALSVYLCGKFACKTLMQGFGFALPLNLTTPLSILFYAYYSLQNTTAELSKVLNSEWEIFRANDFLEYQSLLYSWQFLLLIGVVLSPCLITLHVWNDRNIRLEKTDRIFNVFSYDGLVIDQSLAMSRWRENSCEKETTTIDPEISRCRNEKDVMVYVCATMWHETVNEIKDSLDSIFRLDKDRGNMRILFENSRVKDREYYEIEVHIFFDDAFQDFGTDCERNCRNRGKTVNDFVKSFIQTMKICFEESERKESNAIPTKYSTPYGGLLVWDLPFATKMYLHMKDKTKVRLKKRWSQVMYMYYLLEYRFYRLSDSERDEVAENTYILTLDGDMDFRSTAVEALIDRMRANKDLGSVCGRIHPIGKGPVVWFQKFEYAIGHWLHKSTEHMFGSVLCSPGCFALFRAKALMHRNVMGKYITQSRKPEQYIQYDQGEDRWLCTLLLQEGHRIEYSAASDAYTHAPQTFAEFFLQRRRWIISTVANIFNLINSSKEIRSKNRGISWFFIAYQCFLIVGTILGPGTIFLTLVGAFVAAFKMDQFSSLLWNIFPILIFCAVCIYCTEKIQLLVAKVITIVYGLTMMVVLVGIMIQITEDGWFAPTTILFFTVLFEFIITGLLHPLEWTSLYYIIIYFITVPSMYMLLMIFSLFNMNNVSWGTRCQENRDGNPIKEKESKFSMKNRLVKFKRNEVECLFCNVCRCVIFPEKNVQDETQTISASVDITQPRTIPLERLDKNSQASQSINSEIKLASSRDSVRPNRREHQHSSFISHSREASANWINDPDLVTGSIEQLSSREIHFWNDLIKKYLDPAENKLGLSSSTKKAFKILRDEYLFKFFMINGLFITTIFMMQLHKDILHFNWHVIGIPDNITYIPEENEVNVDTKYLRIEPIGLVLICGFYILIFIQFIGMILHRCDTFSHIMARVTLDGFSSCFNKDNDLSGEAIRERKARKYKNIDPNSHYEGNRVSSQDTNTNLEPQCSNNRRNRNVNRDNTRNLNQSWDPADRGSSLAYDNESFVSQE